MAKGKKTSFLAETSKKMFIMLFAGLIVAIALNMFLIPANVFGAGLNGVAQLASAIFKDYFDIKIQTGVLILLLNIPIAILGWLKIGRDFTLYSFLTSFAVSLFAIILPVREISSNILMNAIIGGVLTGIGVGYSLKFGFSTGGMDIISMVLAKTTGRSVSSLMFMINGIVIAVAGFYFDWEIALYTIISIYCMTRVIDAIHTSHQKMTVMIVTQHPKDVSAAIFDQLIRGITVLPAKGAYTGADSSVLMIVITRYELYDLEQAVKETDSKAFINILPTQSIVGEFWTVDQQKKGIKKN